MFRLSKVAELICNVNMLQVTTPRRSITDILFNKRQGLESGANSRQGSTFIAYARYSQKPQYNARTPTRVCLSRQE